MSRRSDVVILAVGIVVVLGAGVAVAAVKVKSPQLSAETALTQYARAIESGDLTLASQLGPAPKGTVEPISGGALAQAADRITAVTTRIDSNSGSRATGTVTFELSGRRSQARVTLGTGPAQLGVLPNWRVTTPLTTTISVGVPAGGVAVVNGVEAPIGDDRKLSLYPGHYVIGLAAGNRWYTADAVPIDAHGASASVTLNPSPTAALNAAVLEHVKAAIDTCLAQPVPKPTGCPFSEPAVGTLRNFSWKLDQYPEIVFLDPTHFFLQGGQVTANFVLSYSYIVNKQESDPIAIRGTGVVNFTGHSVTATIAPQ